MHFLFRNLFFAGLCLLASISSFAIEKALVLPKNVNYFSVRTAQVAQVSQKYGPNGNLALQGDFYTQNIDLTQLMKFLKPEKKEELQKLVNALNQAGRSDLGNKMHLGQLKIDIEPEVKYACPVFAHGFSDNWTVAVAFPVIQYGLNVEMAQVSSNIPQIKDELHSISEASVELKKGLETIDQDLALAVQDVLAEKGYKKIQSRRDTFLGDVQLVGLYRFFQSSRWTSVLKHSVVLPTGPRDDPDDLTDVTSQHQMGLGLAILQDYHFSDDTAVGANAGYFARLPDQADKRVPQSADDILPDLERKETLNRDLGDTVAGGFGARHSFSDYLELSAGWELGHKLEDKYSGTRDYQYHLLSKNTGQDWQKAMASLEYSTVRGFLQRKESVPYGVSYEFSDIISGRNIDRAQTHEVSLKMYF